MREFIEIIQARKKEVWLGILALIVMCAISIFYIEKNASAYFVGEDHKSRVSNDQMQSVFTRSSDAIIFSLDATESVFQEVWVSAISDIHSKVDSSYPDRIKSLKSIFNSDNMVDQDGDILIEPSYYGSAWLKGGRNTILDNQIFSGVLVGIPGKSVNLFVELNPIPEGEAPIAIIKDLESDISQILNSYDIEADILISGVPALNATISEVIEQDNLRLFPVVVCVIFVVLSFLLKSIKKAFVCLIISVSSVAITFGIMFLLGYQLNIVTTVMPIFIISIAVTDAVHVLTPSDPNQSHVDQMYKLKSAMINTTFTTSIGFLCTSFTDVIQLQSMGVLVAIGISVALIMTWLIIPTFSFKLPSQVEGDQPPRFMTESKFILGGGLVSVLCLIFGMTGIPKNYVNQASIEAFSDSIDIKHDTRRISDLGAGSIPLNLWIKADESVLESSILQTIQQIQSLEDPQVVKTTSIVDYLEELHRVMVVEGELDLTNRPLVEQYMILLEGGSERDIESVFDVIKRDSTRVMIGMKNDDAKSIKSYRDKVIAILEENQIEQYQFNGYAELNVVAAVEILETQIKSMASSGFIVFLIIMVIYRSLWIGVVAVLPLCGTIIVMFGIMGNAGTAIDVGSSIVASITIGIGIDYSIHMIEAWKRTGNAIDAYYEVKRPILISALVLSSGFIVMSLSSFEPIVWLGYLVSIAVVSSALIALFLIPCLLILKDRASSMLSSISPRCSE